MTKVLFSKNERTLLYNQRKSRLLSKKSDFVSNVDDDQKAIILDSTDSNTASELSDISDFGLLLPSQAIHKQTKKLVWGILDKSDPKNIKKSLKKDYSEFDADF